MNSCTAAAGRIWPVIALRVQLCNKREETFPEELMRIQSGAVVRSHKRWSHVGPEERGGGQREKEVLKFQNNYKNIEV